MRDRLWRISMLLATIVGLYLGDWTFRLVFTENPIMNQGELALLLVIVYIVEPDFFRERAQ